MVGHRPPNGVPLEDPQDPPPVLELLHGGDSLPLPPHAPKPLIDDDGYKTSVSDI